MSILWNGNTSMLPVAAHNHVAGVQEWVDEQCKFANLPTDYMQDCYVQVSAVKNPSLGNLS
jgi:hypothetical protein